MKLSAIVTVLKKIQSREPSGSRAPAKLRGWRPRGVPTPSGDRGPRAARLATRRGAGGTAGQQRLLQVPGASAAAVPRGLLRWNQPGSPTRAFGSSATVIPPAASLLREAGLTVQNGRSLLVPAAISLIPGIDLENHN
uniref:Uncharacterized protein n=1 Tax=Lynx canadensis TaxID=61383 RepID=A0A667GL91_LYNCA